MGEPNPTNIITYMLRCFNKRSVFLFHADIFKLIFLLISIQALVSFFCSAIFTNISSICQLYTCAPLPVFFRFLFSDFLGCDSSSSVSLPECVHQMPHHRLQQECISKHSGCVGGFDLAHSFFFYFPRLLFNDKKFIKLCFNKSFCRNVNFLKHEKCRKKV